MTDFDANQFNAEQEQIIRAFGLPDACFELQYNEGGKLNYWLSHVRWYRSIINGQEKTRAFLLYPKGSLRTVQKGLMFNIFDRSPFVGLAWRNTELLEPMLRAMTILGHDTGEFEREYNYFPSAHQKLEWTLEFQNRLEATQ